MSDIKKEKRKSLWELFKKKSKCCCDMEIVEVEDKPDKKPGCCENEILPAEGGNDK